MNMFGVDKWSSLRRIYDVSPRETIPWERLTHLSICRCSLPHAKVVNNFKTRMVVADGPCNTRVIKRACVSHSVTRPVLCVFHDKRLLGDY